MRSFFALFFSCNLGDFQCTFLNCENSNFQGTRHTAPSLSLFLPSSHSNNTSACLSLSPSIDLLSVLRLCHQNRNTNEKAYSHIQKPLKKITISGRVALWKGIRAIKFYIFSELSAVVFEVFIEFLLFLSHMQLPVYSNLTGQRYFERSNFVHKLSQQMVKPVKWEQTMHTIYQRPQGSDFPQTFELGPSGQMGTLLKQINLQAHKSYKCIDVWFILFFLIEDV